MEASEMNDIDSASNLEITSAIYIIHLRSFHSIVHLFSSIANIHTSITISRLTWIHIIVILAHS